MLSTYTRLSTALKTDLPDVVFVDLDQGQLAQPGRFESILSPGVLIALDEIAWEGELGYGPVRLSLCVTLPSQTYATDPYLSESADLLRLADQLHGWATTQPDLLHRTGTRQYGAGSFWVIEHTYEARYEANTLPYDTLNLTVPLHVTAELISPNQP